MTETSRWQASVFEQRMAWGIAIIAIVLMLFASFRPDWFAVTKHTPEPTATKAVSDVAKNRTPAKRIDPVSPAPKRATPPEAAPVVKKNRPQRTTAAVAKPVRTTLANGYYVQVGAFKDRDRAQGMVDQLQRHGWHAVIAEKKKGLHAVRAGPEKSRRAAEQLEKTLAKTLHTKGFIVHQL